MRILVTGGSGFIGRPFVAEMERNGYEVVVFDRTHGHDVRNYNDVCSKIIEGEVELVVHLAASIYKHDCEQSPQEAIDVNAYGTLNVAQVCAFAHVPLVFVSTSEVYGDHGDLMLDEDAPWSETSSGVYALTKRWGEEICRTYAPEGLKIIRPTMPYGPGVPPGRGRRALDNLIWQALTGQDMVVHRGASRSWCWIDDLVSGMRCVIERGPAGAYNVGRDDAQTSMFDLALRVCWATATPPDGRIKLVDPPARQTAIKKLSCRRLYDLGWRPTTNLPDGINAMVDWTKTWLAETAPPS